MKSIAKQFVRAAELGVELECSLVTSGTHEPHIIVTTYKEGTSSGRVCIALSSIALLDGGCADAALSGGIEQLLNGYPQNGR